MCPIVRELDMYVSMACNINCRYCSVAAGRALPGELPIDRLLQIIDEAIDLGLEELHLLGGEPLLHRDLDVIIEHATQSRVAVRVITNGSLLTTERIQSLLSAGLPSIMISVDGTGAGHDYLRQCSESMREKVLAGVRRSVASGLYTRVSMTVFRENIREVIPLLKYADEVGAACFSLFLGSPLGRARSMIESIVAPPEWLALQKEVEEYVRESLASNIQVIMEKGFVWEDESGSFLRPTRGRGVGCSVLSLNDDYLILRSDGKLYQCVFFMNEGEAIGDVSHSSLRSVLKEKKNSQWVRRLAAKSHECRDCPSLEKCQSGCRGYSYLCSGDWFVKDGRCSARDGQHPPYIPVCPIMKQNMRTGYLAGSSEDALAK